jgi:hypothetical protein
MLCPNFFQHRVQRAMHPQGEQKAEEDKDVDAANPSRKDTSVRLSSNASPNKWQNIILVPSDARVDGDRVHPP